MVKHPRRGRDAAKDEFEDYMPHPRYGRGPRYTGLDPKTRLRTPPGEPLVLFDWHSPEKTRIANTAIEADVSRQNFSTMGVTHYFDMREVCGDCKRKFIFFAEERRYWYEELGFRLESSCDCCVPCRKKRRGIERQRERYEELCHKEDRSPAENLEMASCCLSMIEASIFNRRQTERVRMLLKRAPAKEAMDLMARVRAIEEKAEDA